ncbi:hypothetical protein GQ53DRAFT_450613 [Thozetella sp. PMI_491]|nr:hypothetical protein GQ53DRAFT_450613 [Thozetella sp. PMI_491]
MHTHTFGESSRGRRHQSLFPFVRPPGRPLPHLTSIHTHKGLGRLNFFVTSPSFSLTSTFLHLPALLFFSHQRVSTVVLGLLRSTLYSFRFSSIQPLASREAGPLFALHPRLDVPDNSTG